MSLPLWIRGIVVTVLAFTISWIAVYDLMSVSFFSPMEKAADFRFSDFYTLVANDRAVKTLHRSIVIVAVDRCNRSEIAEALDDIDYCMPAAVGLDVAFSTPRDIVDDPLARSIASCGRLVMPVVAEAGDDGTYSVIHSSYYDRHAPDGVTFAAANIEGEKEARFTVRSFKPVFSARDGGDIPSLAYALATTACPEIAGIMKKRGNDEEALKYASREFEIIYPDEILENPDMLAGKIVIVGKVNDAADLHATPVDNFTPGVFIHAHAAATMIDGDFTRRLSAFESWMIAAVACYLVVLLNLRLADSTLGDLTVRILQIAMLYVMIVGGTLAYTHFDIDLDFTNAMLMTSLGVVACDLFNGIFADDGIIYLCSSKIINITNHINDLRNEIIKKRSLKSMHDSAVDDSGVSPS